MHDWGPTRQTVSIAEAAKILGIGKATAYRLVKSGEIPVLKFGTGPARVSVIMLNRFLNTGKWTD